jgi:RNA polymerase sigma factor (sigma-70 family)
MNDHEAVAAILAGDAAGLADVYDRYAAALFGYCRSLLREPQDAADAVQDTFVITAARVSTLRDPGKLRPWLYAVARNECHRRLRSREAPAEMDAVEPWSGQSWSGQSWSGQSWSGQSWSGEPGFVGVEAAADVGRAAQQAELRELVHAAITGLNPPDREVIELNLRHDLDGGELAAVLGVSRSHAHAMASRARAQLEKSLGAVLVARTGRRSCAGLDEILADWDGRLTVLLRKRVHRHISSCATCGERKRRALRPAMLYGFAPVALLPPRLRHQAMALCSDDSPYAMEFKRDVARQAGRFGPDGFPSPLVRIGRRRLNEPGSALVAAASVAAAALVVIAMIALRGSPSLHTLDDNKPSGGPGGAAATSAGVITSPGSAPTSTAPTTTPPSTAAGILPAGPPTSASPTPKRTKPHKTPPKSPSPSPSLSPGHSITPSPSPSPSPTTASPTPTPPTMSPTPPPTITTTPPS